MEKIELNDANHSLEEKMTYKEIIEDLGKEIKEIKAFSETELGKFLEQFQGVSKFHFEVDSIVLYNMIKKYLDDNRIENSIQYFTSQNRVFRSIRIEYGQFNISVYYSFHPDAFESPDCHVVKITTEEISLVCDKEN